MGQGVKRLNGVDYSDGYSFTLEFIFALSVVLAKLADFSNSRSCHFKTKTAMPTKLLRLVVLVA